MPAQPTGLSNTATHDSVTLAWDDPGDDTITGYRILRRSMDRDAYGDGQGGWEFVTIAETETASTTYVDRSVTGGTRYVYRVTAVNAAGASERSSYTNVETLPPPVPTQPTSLEAEAASHEGIDLAWDDPGDSSITGYRILRRSRDGDAYGDGQGAAEFVEVGTTGGAATEYEDRSVTPRTRYVYRVVALNEHGASPRSSFANVETQEERPDEPEPENTPATGALSVTGTAQVGGTLTADTSGVVDADGLSNVQYDYQWLADDSDISGATNATYTLEEAEEGKGIKVQVSFTDDAGNEEALTSTATAAVAAAPTPNSPATGAPTVSGTAQVGETLTANTSGVADTDGLTNVSYSYQWLADDAEIAGATGLTYTLADSDEGKTVKVQISFTDDAGNDETLTSAASDAVATAEPSEPPARPRGLSATATHDRVTLTWDDPGDDAIIGYVILRRVRENDQGGEFSELVADTGTAAITYTDNTVAAGTTYTYRIKAINEYGVSERSRWSHIDIPAAPVPDKPTGLSATATHDQVVLTWNNPGDDSITGYVILRRHRYDDPKGHFDELVADTGTAATTYTDDTVAAGTSYTYRIKAINGAGPGERSRWSHIDTPAAPEQVSRAVPPRSHLRQRRQDAVQRVGNYHRRSGKIDRFRAAAQLFPGNRKARTHGQAGEAAAARCGLSPGGPAGSSESRALSAPQPQGKEPAK